MKSCWLQLPHSRRAQTRHLPHRCDDNRKHLFLNLLIFYLIFILFWFHQRGDLWGLAIPAAEIQNFSCYLSRQPFLFCTLILHLDLSARIVFCSKRETHTRLNTGFVMHCHYWWLQCGNLRIAGRSLLISRFHCWFYWPKLLYLAVLHLFVWERSSEKVVCHGFSDYRWAWGHWVHWTIKLWCWGKLTGPNATGLLLEPKTWTRKLVCKRKGMQITEHLYTAQNCLEMAIVKSLT